MGCADGDKIGLYTLVGRERKSPYLINSVFMVFLVCILGAAVTVASVLAPGWNDQLLYAGAILLLVAVLLTCWRVYKIFIRFALFVDRVSPKDLWLWRKGKDAWRQLRGRAVYEHNPEPISAELLQEVKRILQGIVPEFDSWEERRELGNRSLTMALEHQGQANDVLAKLAIAFLCARQSVQYLTASRHPIEFIEYLQGQLVSDGRVSWQDAAQRLVVVDAFTPHFGFTDSIHLVKSREIGSSLGVAYVRSSVSYAGMHTASSKAFNIIKKRAGGEVRKPVLVIYEDTYALADLESPTQYRVFVRHVLPSERLWDGMFTVFTEVAQPDADWKVLSSYASISLDLRAKEHPAANAENL